MRVHYQVSGKLELKPTGTLGDDVLLALELFQLTEDVGRILQTCICH